MGFTAPQASKKTFGGHEASSQAPPPPPCFAGWSPSPAIAGADEELLRRLGLDFRQRVRVVALLDLLRLAGELDGQVLPRVGQHKRQNIRYFARLDLGNDFEQHASVEGIENFRSPRHWR